VTRKQAQADMLLAATAQVNQQMLVTRNTRDFEGCGITSLLDPFSKPLTAFRGYSLIQA